MKSRNTLKRTAGFICVMVLLLNGCSRKMPVNSVGNKPTADNPIESTTIGEESAVQELIEITPTSTITELEKGLSIVRFDGDDGFATFLQNGGAASDAQVVQYLTKNLLHGERGLSFSNLPFGCSTISADGEKGERLFGRNFDWYNCNALIVENHPEHGYSSLSTVNTDFITQSAGRIGSILLKDEVLTLAAIYAPLDGMNEKGLCVSVNMIQDSATINQNTDKPDITTTTAVRMLLNEAANVDEAVKLLGDYDFHASFGYMVHLALSDRDGRSVVVEYVNDEMIVTDTPIVTNFYIAQGEKNGIGTQQSHKRFEILQEIIQGGNQFSMEAVRDALERVSKHNFHDGETTEWSVVFNQTTGEAWYYHRENYDNQYCIVLD